MRLGSRVGEPTVSIREAPKDALAWMGRRQLAIRGRSAFELSFWCGTCPFLFERLDDDPNRVTFDSFTERLQEGLQDIDLEVVDAVATLLPEQRYIPLLLEVTPERVAPGSDRDYFAHEQTATWNEPDGDPGTDYYRTFEAPVSDDAHLYEFVVPLVPPSWNDQPTLDVWASRLASGTKPTALALTTLDISAPAMDQGPDWYAHWGLTHFLLDGHHKVAAATKLHTPITILSLVAVESGISSVEEVRIALTTRADAADAPRARRA